MIEIYRQRIGFGHFLMFSQFYFRKPVQAGSKRSSSNDEEEVISTEPPQDKMPRLELDDNDDGSDLQEELITCVQKYLKKHYSDKSLKEKILEGCAVPTNIEKPPKVYIYIKEMINETFAKARNLRLDGYLTGIQTAIRNIFGPLSEVWKDVQQRASNFWKKMSQKKTRY